MSKATRLAAAQQRRDAEVAERKAREHLEAEAQRVVDLIESMDCAPSALLQQACTQLGVCGRCWRWGCGGYCDVVTPS